MSDRCMELKVQDPDSIPSPLKFTGHAKESDLRAPLKQHIKATPLFELSSVSICRDTESSDEQPTLAICGQIKFIDNDKNEFLLFDQSVNDPNFMLNGEAPIIQKFDLGGPQPLPQYFSLDLFLLDKIRNREIINGQMLQNSSCKVDYDVEEKCEFKTDYGLVTVCYTFFRCAVVAFVKFTVFKIGETGSGSVESDDIRVRGTMLARSRVSDCEEITRVLFDSYSMAAYFVLSSPIELPPLAVPAYSSLKLEADLEVEGEKVVSDGNLEFRPSNWCHIPFKEDILGENWRIQVTVTWGDALDFPEENKSSELIDYKCDSSCTKESESFSSDCEDISDRDGKSIKRRRLFPDEPSLSNVKEQGPVSNSLKSAVVRAILKIFKTNNFIKRAKLFTIKRQDEDFNPNGLKSALCERQPTFFVFPNLLCCLELLSSDESYQSSMSKEMLNIMFEQAVQKELASRMLQEHQVKSSPSFALSSVSICKDTTISDRLSYFAFYGQIKLIDDKKNEFLLFDRNEDDPVLTQNSKPAVIREFHHPRFYHPVLTQNSKPQSFLLKLHLIDKIRNIKIIDDELFLDFSGKVIYDVEQEFKFNTGFGIVTVCYTIFPSSVLASVECEICRQSVESDECDSSSIKESEKLIAKDTTSDRKGRSCCKRSRLCSNESPLLNVSEQMHLSKALQRMLLLPAIEYSRCLVEVFSIAVVTFARHHDFALNVFGTIKTVDSFEKRTIFDKEGTQKPGKVCPTNKTLLLEGLPCCLDGSYFAMLLDLKDASLGREICRGVVGCNGLVARHLLDRRICSVVSGECGFAAVHYTMFKYGISAHVEAYLRGVCSGGGGSCCRVYGSIRAWYNTYKYVNHYEKNYYQILLFERDKSEPIIICNDDEKIPLLRHVVAVPADAHLIVDVDLHYLVAGAGAGDKYERLTTVATFNPAAYGSKSEDSTLKELGLCVKWQ